MSPNWRVLILRTLKIILRKFLNSRSSIPVFKPHDDAWINSQNRPNVVESDREGQVLFRFLLRARLVQPEFYLMPGLRELHPPLIQSLIILVKAELSLAWTRRLWVCRVTGSAGTNYKNDELRDKSASSFLSVLNFNQQSLFFLL